MFTDLIKGKKPAARKKDVSEERLDELMDKLFSKGEFEEEFDIEEDEDEEDVEKGESYFARKAKKARKEMIKGNDDEDDEEDEDETEDEDEMEKADGKGRRRAMMSKVYSMVDDLSDKELEAFLQSRQVKKAMVMNVFNQMNDAELSDFVNTDTVNGFTKMENMDKGEMKENSGKLSQNELAEIEKNLSMYGFTE